MGAMQKILNGERPRRPDRSDFTDSLWELTQRCWSKEPWDRPGVREVIEVLKELSVFDSSSERRISHTRSHRSADHVTKTPPTPPGVLPTVPKGLSTIVSLGSSTGDVTVGLGEGEAEMSKGLSAFCLLFEWQLSCSHIVTDAAAGLLKPRPNHPESCLQC